MQRIYGTLFDVVMLFAFGVLVGAVMAAAVRDSHPCSCPPSPGPSCTGPPCHCLPAPPAPSKRMPG